MLEYNNLQCKLKFSKRKYEDMKNCCKYLESKLKFTYESYMRNVNEIHKQDLEASKKMKYLQAMSQLKERYN